MAKQTKKGTRNPLTEEQKKARAAKAAETRKRNKAKKEAEARKKAEELAKKEAETKVEETTIEEVVEDKSEDKKTIDVDGDFTMDDFEKADDQADDQVKDEVEHVVSKEELEMNPQLKEHGVKEGDVITLGDECESEDCDECECDEPREDELEDENLRRYIGNAVTNHAQRAVESGLLHMDENSLRLFVEESCNQCQYGDVERAMNFAVKCVNRVSSTLLMNNI